MAACLEFIFTIYSEGSAEWINWSRAGLALQRTAVQGVFELRAAKRGNRLGWKEADGTTTAYCKTIAHHKEPGTICWIGIDPDALEGGQSNLGLKQEVLKHVPLDRPVPKNDLIETCGRNGMGSNKARDLIDELVENGDLFVWKKPRAGTQPEKYLARIPQQLDANGKEIFTEMFTPI